MSKDVELKLNVSSALLALVAVTMMSPLLLWGSTIVLEKIWHWFLEADYGAGPSRQSWIGIQIFMGWAAITIRRPSDEDNEKKALGFVVDAVLRAVLNAGYFLVIAAWVRVFWG